MAATDHHAIVEYQCLDDLMRDVIKCLFQSKDRFKATKGDGNEMLGVTFRLTNPRARLSRSEMRGKIFSALGELFWCLSGSNRIDFISHYILAYKKNTKYYSEDGVTVHGAYGPRVFGEGEWDQVRNIIKLLKDKPGSRRAVIQIFAASDLRKHYADVPCTCTLQAILRQKQLNLIVHMRSNDAYLGLPHDIFVFTMLQELIARALKADLGFYQHMVGHLHLYDDDQVNAKDYLDEGVQAIRPMPPMPSEDPLSLIPELVRAEAAIRDNPRSAVGSEFGPYWGDIIRLLQMHSENHYKFDGYKERMEQIKKELREPTYSVYIS